MRALAVLLLTLLAAPALADGPHCWCRIHKSDCGDCQDSCIVHDYGAIAQFRTLQFGKNDLCREACAAKLDGIKKEHDQFFSDHDAAPEIADLFLAGAGARAEHYEIAAYSGLITMARALGEDDAASLLEKNLEQEKAALSKLETAVERISSESTNGSSA